MRSNDSESNSLAINQIKADDIQNSGTPEDRYIQYIILIIIAACFIFVCMVISFAGFCILHAKRKLKLEEQIFTRSSHCHLSLHVAFTNKKSFICSTQPLRPDVRREPQDLHSIFGINQI